MQTAAERDAHIIANARNWTAFAFAGRGNRRRLDFTSREAAFAGARSLAAEMGRIALVYAVGPQGQQALAGSVSPKP